MTTKAIVKQPEQSSCPWSASEINTIRNTVAKGATPDELKMFLHLASTYSLDPFAREIWFIKTREKPVIMTSRDGYLKIANNKEDFDGMEGDVVYQGDLFQKNRDGVTHTYKLTNRGRIMGAYAIVHKKNITCPIYVFAPFSNYYKNNTVWNQYPHAMILKVAESMALKRAFSINGMVTKEELDEEETQPVTLAPAGNRPETAESETAEQPPVQSRELNCMKAKLYEGYMKLFDDDRKTVRQIMLGIAGGKNSSQWTEEDIAIMEEDLKRRMQGAEKNRSRAQSSGKEPAPQPEAEQEPEEKDNNTLPFDEEEEEEEDAEILDGEVKQQTGGYNETVRYLR